MNVGWLADPSDTVGGAELSQQEFRDTAPQGVTVLDCPPDEVWPEVDAYVVHNCVTYPAATIDRFAGRPVVKFCHDVWPHGNPTLKDWLTGHAHLMFCSPLQRDHMGLTGTCVPPAVNLQAFRDQAQTRRHGNVWVGNMLNHGKGLRLASEWAAANGEVHFYGAGPLRPSGPNVVDCGPVAYDELPSLLGTAERLVFLPLALEPFGRVVAEAWAAGCKVTTNKLVGAAWWIENHPDELDTAADRFWARALEVLA